MSISKIYLFSNICFIIILFSPLSTTGLVVDDGDMKDLIITTEEKKSLEQVKFRMLKHLPEEFMKTDFYLIRFVRNAKLNVDEAVSLLRQNIEWRQEQNISRILYEDFSDLEPDYHMSYYGGRDKKGRPFVTVELGEWDLRAAVLQGKTKRLNRFLVYVLERGIHELFRAQKTLKRPITKGLVLIDGEGGNARQHLCAQCLAILMSWIQTMELYYPRFIKEVIMINAPPITAIGLRILKPAMSPETQAALRIFNENKKVWMAYLDERINRNQRTPRYGGNRPEEYNQHFHGAVYKNDFKLED